MRAREYAPMIVMIISALLVMSCLLPGMIPLTREPETPLPTMEENADTVIEVLNGRDWHSLPALAQEKYTEEDYAKPGTLAYTVNITDDKPTIFNYAWCAVDEETLRQNFEHIDIKFFINDNELGNDVVHNLRHTSRDNLLCLDFVVLIMEWPAGEYKLEVVATFNEKINDGLADYEAGDYISVYDVTVEK